MNNTIGQLYNFQKFYLKQIVDNIPQDRLFEKQSEGFNSAGWLLGHLVVEADSVMNFLNLSLPAVPTAWKQSFAGGGIWDPGRFESFPTKKQLLTHFEERYDEILDAYEQLNEEEKAAEHPSLLLANIYANVDAWIAHHLVNHIAVHCGNIVVWKKAIGLPVQGL